MWKSVRLVLIALAVLALPAGSLAQNQNAPARAADVRPVYQALELIAANYLASAGEAGVDQASLFNVAAGALGGEATGQVTRDSYLELFAARLAARTSAGETRATVVRDLNDKALSAVAEALKESTYISKADYDLMTGQRVLGGSGVELTAHERGARIVGVYPETPAQRAGILPNDILVSVDGVDLAGKPLTEVVRLTQGEVGSTVRYKIDRGGEMLDFAPVRIIIRPARSKAVSNGVALIKPMSFNEALVHDVRVAVNELFGRGERKGLILDLRGNPGGLLDAATGLADLFMESGPIATLARRNPNDADRYLAHTDDVLAGAPLIVLVDGGTGSGAEIVAGALRDNGRAILVGSRTFGHGVIQTIYPIQGGAVGALRLKTAEILIAQRRSVEGVGLEPNLVVQRADDGKRETRLGDPALLPSARPTLLAAGMGDQTIDVSTDMAALGGRPDDAALAAAIRLLHAPRPPGT